LAARGAAPVGSGEAVPGWLWRAVTYFSLWSLRLGGWLPPLNVCVQSGVELEPDQAAYFERSQPGLLSAEFRTRDSWAMSSESRAIAAEMLKRPLGDLRAQTWDRKTAEDLRRFLTQRLEAQVESRLKTAAVLAEL
jgi:DNA repair protein RecO (recombination protein O)